jgi:maleate isomerase
VSAELEASYERVLEELREATDASRVTLRLDTPGQLFPVVAEVLAPGVNSIRDVTHIDLRAAKTFQFVEREKRMLIQEDCAAGDHPAPPEVLEVYRMKAQMLGPLVRDDRLVGVVSVHYAPSTRRWSASDVRALENAVARIQELLPQP